MELATPIQGSAQQISEIAEQHRPGNGPTVYDYLQRSGKGYAIPILSTKEIEPISLDVLRSQFDFRAPQSYQSLAKHPTLLQFLLEKAGVVE